MIDKHPTMMSDNEVVNEYKDLSTKRRMKNIVNMNLSVAEENQLCQLREEVEHRELDAEGGKSAQ